LLHLPVQADEAAFGPTRLPIALALRNDVAIVVAAVRRRAPGQAGIGSLHDEMSGDGIRDGRQFLESIFPSPQGDFFECTDDEGEKAFLHRFVAADAAVRYRAGSAHLRRIPSPRCVRHRRNVWQGHVHSREVEDIVALDVALRRNDRDWFEALPDEITGPILHKLYYGHFFCHVFHQDYIVRKGHNTLELEHKMWRLLDARGAQFPAEHSFGHLYYANSALIDHFKSLDPCNCLNPGIGRTSKHERWHDKRQRYPEGPFLDGCQPRVDAQ